MTWLSERSGIASIGVVSSAQYPQAPTSTNSAITRKRFLSDSSMSQLTTHTPPRRRGPCAQTRAHGERRLSRRTDERQDARRKGMRLWAEESRDRRRSPSDRWPSTAEAGGAAGGPRQGGSEEPP